MNEGPHRVHTKYLTIFEQQNLSYSLRNQNDSYEIFIVSVETHQSFFVNAGQTKFKDIQGPGGKKSSFSRTFKDFKDNFKNSRISRFLKDRGNHG